MNFKVLETLSSGIFHGLILNPWFIGMILVNLAGIIYTRSRVNYTRV